jgi:Protein of unknown function (DUF2997)
MTRVIEVTISITGQTTLATKGFQGASCRDASRFLEQALGSHQYETVTAEFYQDVHQRTSQSQRI